MTEGRHEDPLDAPRLLAELRVHQAELETQNEALRSARDAAEAARANYEHLYEFAPVGYATVGTTGNVIAANLSLAMMLGVDRAELLGRPFTQWVAPVWRRTVMHHLTRAQGEEPAETLPCEMVTAGDTHRWVALTTSAMADGTMRRVAVIDETQRHAADLVLQHAHKMEAVSRMAGGLAHELNNLLTVIGGHTDLILEALPEGHAVRADAESARDAVHRAGALTTRLLAFAKPQALQRQRLPLASVIAEFVAELQRTLPTGVTLALGLSPDTGFVIVDRTQLDETLRIVTRNAIEAMPSGGTLAITTTVADLSAAMLAGEIGVHPGRFVHLRVADTGVGMPEDTLPHVFEPFFTTKRMGEGAGLGLSLVYAIVRQAGGVIRLESEVGRGTTIDILLPQATMDADAPPAPVLRRSTDLPRSGQTVLVADDEAGVLALVERVLESLGLRCLLASDGEEALAIAEAHEGAIDLIVSDVVMPRLSGPAFVALYRHRHPDVPVIFMTGYATALEVPGIAVPPHQGFLRKPFTIAELAAVVRQVLTVGAA
jgi:two-component system, cell cycle sensor histidine kinase and response regulator CckA